MAPPGIPKTTSAPTLSRDRTSDWAPVTVSDISGLPSVLDSRKLATKNPSCGARRGERVCRPRGLRADALANYDQVTHPARLRDGSRPCQASGTPVPHAGPPPKTLRVGLRPSPGT